MEEGDWGMPEEMSFLEVIEKGMYYPYIDANSCISCGICKKVCPGLSHRYENQGYKAVEGKVLISYSVEQVA